MAASCPFIETVSMYLAAHGSAVRCPSVVRTYVWCARRGRFTRHEAWALQTKASREGAHWPGVILCTTLHETDVDDWTESALVYVRLRPACHSSNGGRTPSTKCPYSGVPG